MRGHLRRRATSYGARYIHFAPTPQAAAVGYTMLCGLLFKAVPSLLMTPNRPNECCRDSEIYKAPSNRWAAHSRRFTRRLAGFKQLKDAHLEVVEEGACRWYVKNQGTLQEERTSHS